MKMSLIFCDFPDCTYKSSSQDHVKRHKANIHDIDVKWNKCDQINCDYKSKNASDLKKHIANIHSINVEWKKCDIQNCTFKTKQSSNLSTHKAMNHNIDVKWFKCDMEHCTYKSKRKNQIVRHKRDIHNINVVWCDCDIPECGFKTKTNSNLKKHKSNIHGIDTKIFKCDYDLCEYQSKTDSGLKKHKSNIHNVDVKWHHCDSGCNLKFKSNSDLKQHKAAVHNINTRWFKCDIPNCGHQAKRNTDLNKHKRNVHDIGDLNCECCYKKCAHLTHCTFETDQIQCCRACYYKITGHKSSSEKNVCDWLKLNYKYPIIKANQTVNGEVCLKYRPDIMYASENLVIYIEVDEYQHKTNNDYSCDERRMSDLYDETPGKLVVFVRFNPDVYLPQNKETIIPLEDRLKLLLSTLNYITSNYHQLISENYIHCFYLFYSHDNKIIAKNLPTHLIYSINDLINIGNQVKVI